MLPKLEKIGLAKEQISHLSPGFMRHQPKLERRGHQEEQMSHTEYRACHVVLSSFEPGRRRQA